MATSIRTIRGPYVKHTIARSIYKNEDAWIQSRDVQWTPADEEGSVTYDFFGVFDGHGGKQAATFCSKHLLPKVQQLCSAPTGKLEPAKPPLEASALDTAPAEDLKCWQLQDKLLAALPAALSQGFQEVELDFFSHTKVSGTTATAAALVGWDLIVASVGDSCAYVDTGAEVVQVSGNHRLDDSKTERQRCEQAGYEVCQSTVDGKPVGPKRVWPGGLAMSRTIGDLEAGKVVTPEPEVRQLTLPLTGGRVIIASDGLWDAVHPKTAAHHIRGLPASKAANELMQVALKSRGLRDDITVIVVDAMPDDTCRLPPLLAKGVNGRPLNTQAAGTADWHRPLEETENLQWKQHIWQRRLAALSQVQAAQAVVDDPMGASEASTNTNITVGDEDSSSVNDIASAVSSELQAVAVDGDDTEWETIPVKQKHVATTDSEQQSEEHADAAGEREEQRVNKIKARRRQPAQAEGDWDMKGSPDAAQTQHAVTLVSAASGSADAAERPQHQPRYGNNGKRQQRRQQGNNRQQQQQGNNRQQQQGGRQQHTQAPSACQNDTVAKPPGKANNVRVLIVQRSVPVNIPKQGGAPVTIGQAGASSDFSMPSAPSYPDRNGLSGQDSDGPHQNFRRGGGGGRGRHGNARSQNPRPGFKRQQPFSPAAGTSVPTAAAAKKTAAVPVSGDTAAAKFGFGTVGQSAAAIAPEASVSGGPQVATAAGASNVKQAAYGRANPRQFNNRGRGRGRASGSGPRQMYEAQPSAAN